MIIDLEKFIAGEGMYWRELESVLNRLDLDPAGKMSLEEARRFHYLYQRTSSDLAKIVTFSAEPQMRRYLENLVSQAYGEIHGTRRLPPVLRFLRRRLTRGFPAAFRRHAAAFWISLAITLSGALFGGLAVAYDREARHILIPFPGLSQSPAERVSEEEGRTEDHLAGGKATFAALLMTHNIRVSILIFAMGMTAGIGSITLLFYNGVILGAVASDYILAGQTKFLLGWLLPHGAVEIPAILIAGQAGLLLAAALVRWGSPHSLRRRLQEVAADLVSLLFGLALLLLWAGVIEAFLSQYHEPVLPYAFKIAFGTIELTLLLLFLFQSGRSREPGAGSHEG